MSKHLSYSLLTSNIIEPVADPVTDYNVANKKYVDAEITAANTYAESLIPANISQQQNISLNTEVIGGYPGAITSGDAITLDCYRYGTMIIVHLRSKADLITTGAVRIDSTTALPVAYRPTIDMRTQIRITDNGNVDEGLDGYVAISSAGIVTICKTLDEDFANPWTNATLGGWFSAQLVGLKF